MIANLELLYTPFFLVSLAGASACFKIRLSGSKEWIAKRVKKSDAREIESFYQQYYENYVRALDKGQQADR